VRVVQGGLRIAASDLANFLACRHLTRLDIAAAYGLVKPTFYYDLGAEALAQRGREHEARVLASFARRGWRVEDLTAGESDRIAGAAATEKAMRTGIDIIYQGTLLVSGRLGLPDFLVRADLLGPSMAGELSYEVVEAKLARSAKARAVLQTTFYSALVADVQGREPEHMYLALGDEELQRFRVADYAAYMRQVGALLSSFTTVPPPFLSADTYPEPVEHCAICRWRGLCQRQRRDDDDLSLIAGILTRQRKALKAAGVGSRRAFAGLETVPTLDRVSTDSMARAHAQARVQVAGEDSGRLVWEFIVPERADDGALAPNRGLTALPPPSDGDLFFDIEGARYYSEDSKEYGLQYLFGIADSSELDHEGRPVYHAFWSFDRDDEKQAFQRLVDFIVERKRRHPDLHVYHYNHYEPTALDHLSELHETREDVIGRLMGRFATREEDVDNLLRGRVFVDLYRVVRQSVRASIESYSLKQIEGLYEFRRQVALQDVNERMVCFEIALDDHGASRDLDSQRLIQGYNEDDCRSTLGLRDWLEERRDDLSGSLGNEVIPRPVPPEVPQAHVDADVEALREALLAGIPVEGRLPEQEARALMADLLEWHRRDAKPGWWRFFHLHDLTDNELVGEPDAIAGLELEGTVGEVKRSWIVRYRFPPQEHSFRQGDQAVDPRTDKQWTIYSVDDAAGTLDIRRGKENDSVHPSSLIAPGPINTSNHRARLRDLASEVVKIGEATWGRGPEFDLLLRRRPRLGLADSTSLRERGESAVDAGRRIAVALIECHLPIQGPPGTGKTYTGAKQVSDLVARGRRVGVTANSHAAIRNLLNEAAEQNELGRPLLIAQKPDAEGVFASPYATSYAHGGQVLNAIHAGEAEVIGATAWLWTREDFRDTVDVLIVDEASQMSLANALAAAHAAPNLVLLGDPLQLGQPSSAAHPPGAGVSALERVLGDATTMPEDRGLFLEQTRRMHPNVCTFTSEVFYEGRLEALPVLANQTVLGPGPLVGSGLRVVDVVHFGNDDSSPEEARVVAELLMQLKDQEWRTATGEIGLVGLEGVLIVTPFNAQVREIQEALRSQGLTRARVGTVDKFQGQQAPVVIYSTASSTAEDAPRGMEFLYDLRRLNVATSRARCLAILVSSPELVRVYCSTPRQMVLASALCRFRELATSHVIEHRCQWR
jgi:uncharacterized protein